MTETPSEYEMGTPAVRQIDMGSRLVRELERAVERQRDPSPLTYRDCADLLGYLNGLRAERDRGLVALEQIAAATGHDNGYCVDCAAVLVDIARTALAVPLRRPDLP